MKLNIYATCLAYDKNKKPIKGAALRKFNSLISPEILSDMLDDPYNLKKYVAGGNIHFKTQEYKKSVQDFRVNSTYILTDYLTDEQTNWLVAFTKRKWNEAQKKTYGKKPVNAERDTFDIVYEDQRVKFLLSELI